jgi:hypothetical protein
MPHKELTCRHCGEPFVPKVGTPRPGFVNVCPECYRERNKPIVSDNEPKSIGEYQFELQTMDGRIVFVDGKTTFGYNEVNDYGQLAQAALGVGRMCSVARSDGESKECGEWKAGKVFPVPVLQDARRAEMIKRAKAHRFKI